MDAITIKNLKKSYKNVTALNDVSLNIEAGDLFFLLGASGCGKTTLLRSIAGLDKPNSGRIFFGDKDVTDLATHKREAAMVFQNYALWPHMTVGENVAFGLEERNIKGDELVDRVLEALKGVHLEGYEDRRIDQLSGGQQQRVALARALVVRPKCLLLDEPLSNLDAQLRIEMRAEIRRIVKENELTAVYVTHDQEEALSIADKIAVFHEGTIKQVGTPEEIYRWPQNTEVAEFIGLTNLIPAKVDWIVRDNPDDYVVRAVTTNREIFQGKVTSLSPRPEIESQVLVSVRPEAFRINLSGDVLNQIQGVVVERIYQGATIQYLVRLPNGEYLHVSQMNPHNLSEPGDAVSLTARQKDVIILHGS